MTTRMDTRLSRLEARRPKEGEMLIAGLAVEHWPNEDDAEKFFTDLIADRGWSDIARGSVFVVPGPDAILFEPVKLEGIKPDTEAIWLKMGGTYPHAQIHGDRDHRLVLAFASEADRRQWEADTGRSLAMEA